MIIIITHKFAHRLLTNGTMQSAEFDGKLINGVFRPIDPVEMQLTGGDLELVHNLLDQVNHTIQEGYELPHSNPIAPKESFIEGQVR